MLRVGLTGGLASGKSAVGSVFAEGGAHVFSADAIGRALMQPGEPVFAAIVDHFGPEVLSPSGLLDRAALARLAFEQGRLHELNALVHPAVFRAQERLLAEVAIEDPSGIAVVESALIFQAAAASAPVIGSGSRSESESGTDSGSQPGSPAWRTRFDRLVLVTAPDEQKIARYIARTLAGRTDGAPLGPDALAALAAQARARLGAQLPDAGKIPLCDYVIENTGSLVLLRRRAQAVLASLRAKVTERAEPAEGPKAEGPKIDRS